MDIIIPDTGYISKSKLWYNNEARSSTKGKRTVSTSHTAPLRQGQLFQLARTAQGSWDSLNRVVQLSEAPNDQEVASHEMFWVYGAHWTFDGTYENVPSNYRIQAKRTSTGPGIWFYQDIGESLWLEHNPSVPYDQVSQRFLDVTNVRWLPPSAHALKVAVDGIHSEHLVADLLDNTVVSDKAKAARLYAVSDPITPADVVLALSILRKWKIPNPEEALRERGFRV